MEIGKYLNCWCCLFVSLLAQEQTWSFFKVFVSRSALYQFTHYLFNLLLLLTDVYWIKCWLVNNDDMCTNWTLSLQCVVVLEHIHTGFWDNRLPCTFNCCCNFCLEHSLFGIKCQVLFSNRIDSVSRLIKKGNTPNNISDDQ